MEAYVLDDRLRRIQCVDLFNSFIWAERYSEKGDFSLVIDFNSPAKKHFKKGTKIVIKQSYKVMTVDTIKRTVDADGAEVIKITGYSDESIFDARLAKANFDNLELTPNWELTGTPRDIMKKMVYDICVDGILSVQDIIPFLVEGDLIGSPGTWLSLPDLLFWDETLGEWESYSAPPDPVDPIEEITINAKPQSLYATLKEVCDVFGLGFRLVRNFDRSELYFEIYAGQDRTSLQTYFNPVRFSVDIGNLISSAEIDTDKDTYNVAYVFSKISSEVVYAEGESAETAVGFNRRVAFLEVTDYDQDQTPEDHSRLLKQRGAEFLAQHRPSIAFDGEISKAANYKYGVDYDLGDLVELKNADGIMSLMRVTEQIFVHDMEGERSYPTLSNVSTINPNTWAGVSPVLYWNAAEGYWVDWV